MSAIVLFRFHGHFDACHQRVRVIRALNPDLRVFGLYGGPIVEFDHAERAVGSLLDGLWMTPTQDARWKWQHQDQAVREWFIKFGSSLRFDRVYDHEYDLLVAAPLRDVLPAVSERGVALSGLLPLTEVAATWYWTTVEPYASGARRHDAYLRARYGDSPRSFACQGPFPVLSRRFLEAIASVEYPPDILSDVNCEITYPALAVALGFDVVDTGLHPDWRHARPGLAASPLFHCERVPPVGLDAIASELARADGRRAFHPVKQPLPAEHVLELLDLTRRPHGPAAQKGRDAGR